MTDDPLRPMLSRLGNGVAVLTQAMPGIRTAAVQLAADVGSRHEAETENGLAHLFEHMVFKGTENRTARQIAEAAEDVGANLNAWTSRDMTMFHIRTLGEDVPLGLELVTDLIARPRFDATELEREKAVIHSEIGEAQDTPDDVVFDHLQALAYPGHALGRPVLGREDSVSAATLDWLSGWRRNHYHGASTLLVVAGSVDHARVVDQAVALLGGLPETGPPDEPPASWGGGALGESRRIEQMHLTIGFEAPGGQAPDFHAALLFATALGGGMSSRLFQELREERGLAYSVSASHTAHEETGLLCLYCAARPADSETAALLAMDVARSTAATLSEGELQRARAQVKAGLLMGLEGPGGQAEWLSRGFLSFGRIYAPEEAIAELDALTVEQVRATGSRMLASRPAIAAVGPRADRLATRLGRQFGL